MSRHKTSRLRQTPALAVIAGLVCAVVALCASQPAIGLVIYEWQGVCADGCTGTASATILLDDTYTPGAPFICTPLGGSYHCPLIELTYIDSNFNRTFSNVNRDFIAFEGSFFPATSGSQAQAGLLYTSGGFLTFLWLADGTWATTRPNTSGTSSMWTLSLVSEPAPVALIGLGLAAAALARRRKGTRTARHADVA